jgi:hypothetical protein
MDWLIAAAQQPAAKSSSPLWWSPVLGGIGAMLGGGLTSTVAWRVLSDTKAARTRAEEREATGVVTAALLKVHQTYRKWDGKAPVPDGSKTWTDFFHAELAEAEVAAMVFRSAALRKRLKSSLDLLIWGASDDQLLHETRLTFPRVVAYAAHQDAMDCLGANLRNEALPEPSPRWTSADNQMQWQFEQVRRAEEGE